MCKPLPSPGPVYNQAKPEPEPQTVETIDITPTWEGSMRVYIALLESPQKQKKARTLIHQDLLDLARWADKRKKQEDYALAATVAVAVEEIDRLAQEAHGAPLAEEVATAAIIRIQAAAKGEQA